MTFRDAKGSLRPRANTLGTRLPRTLKDAQRFAQRFSRICQDVYSFLILMELQGIFQEPQERSRFPRIFPRF